MDGRDGRVPIGFISHEIVPEFRCRESLRLNYKVLENEGELGSRQAIHVHGIEA